MAEPWLRGLDLGVDPVLSPTLLALQQAREDLASFTAGLTPEQIWARPHGLAPVGFHLRHIAGSLDRLTTYLEGGELNREQFTALQQETLPGSSRDELLAAVERSLAYTEKVIRSRSPDTLSQQRFVGRAKLPTTVIGLIVHIAEHTQRHVGQTISAAQLARSSAMLE